MWYFKKFTLFFLWLLFNLDLETLERRRLRLDIYFLFKILNGIMYCLEFLSRLTFNTSVKITRSNNIFYIRTQLTNYSIHLPVNSLIQFVNNLELELFYSPSLLRFKSYCNFKLKNLMLKIFFTLLLY